MMARVIFTTFLLLSTVYAHLRYKESHGFLIILYGLIVFIFCLSFLYAFLARRIEHHAQFTTIQFAIDTFIITLIVFITGGYYSFFTFLYLP